MKARTKVIAGVGTVVALIALITLRMTSSGHAEKTVAVTPVAVEVTPVASSTLTETVSAVGTISAVRDVVVSSETVGRVTRVLVKVGDFVRQGQTLVQVDDELKSIAVDQAEVQVLAAETSFKKALRDFERAESLFFTKDISDAELESYRLGYRSAEAQHKGAVVNLRIAQRALDDARVKSPISGYVASKNIEVGEMLRMGDRVANIVDMGSVKVKLSIPEEEISKVRVHQEAALHIDSVPDNVFQAFVHTVGSKTETPMGHTYPVEVVVENKNKDISLLKAGMFARVEIKASAVADAMTISKESLLDEDTVPKVFVAENNIARIRPLKLGVRSGDRIQVLEGLRAGDLVISFGQKQLKDGSLVQFKQ
ncbi:MAG: efflux transporter, family, subunit [Bacteroidetes bacterium]|nr:efflux transporter, family, subunit [Bacteroidota bacterium]